LVRKKKENILNIPNALSLLRILLVPFLVIQLLGENILGSLLILAVIMLSDFFDGLIARKFNQTTGFGDVLDMLGDFSYYLATLISFYILGWLNILNKLLLLAVILAMFHFLYSLYKKNKWHTVPHFKSAKIMAVMYVVSFVIMILQVPYAQWLLTITFFVTFFYTFREYLQYFKQ
jgi:cardiolipin synthase (CMP-forming)